MKKIAVSLFAVVLAQFASAQSLEKMQWFNEPEKWEEFKKDYSSRTNLEAIIARLDNLSTKIKNAKILHDYDNYQAALTDYAYTTYKAGTASPGYETKQNDLKQFFANRTTSNSLSKQ